MDDVASEHHFGPDLEGPAAATVIVVTWRPEDGLARCLAALAGGLADTEGTAEVIVVGNGVDVAGAEAPLVAAGVSGWLVVMAENDGPSPARNAAAARASGVLLAFLDDDAIPNAGWLDGLRRGLDDNRLVAVRGRVVADEHPWLTRLARGYDLGPTPRPAFLNTEGNMAVRARAFATVGGFAAMFGHEGVELSTRLRDEFGPDAIGYVPDAVIRHDYVDGLGRYLGKRFRHGRNMRHLRPAEIRMAASVRPPMTWQDRLLSPVRLVGAVAEVLGVAWGSLRRVRSA